MIATTGLLLCLILPGPSAQEPKPSGKIVPAAEAKSHIDETATVEMKVKLSKNGEKQMTYYLDSEADYNDENNVAVLISYKHADSFKAAGIDDPSVYYRGKTIRVTGKIIKESKQTRMKVESPKAIEVVGETK